MVEIHTNNAWSETVDAVLARGSHYFEQLDCIVATTNFCGDSPAFMTLGQYDSWKPAILLNSEIQKDKNYTLLHELGHHLHFLDVFGHPQEKAESRDEWADYFGDNLHLTPAETTLEIEYIADVFANWHLGKVDSVPLAYKMLEGPQLDAPIATDL